MIDSYFCVTSRQGRLTLIMSSGPIGEGAALRKCEWMDAWAGVACRDFFQNFQTTTTTLRRFETTMTKIMPERPPRPQQQHATRLITLLFVILFVCLFSIFGPTFWLVQHHDAHHTVDVRQIHNHPNNDGGMETQEETSLQLLNLPDLIQLPHESLLWSTIKSCIPDEDKEEKKKNEKDTKQTSKCLQFIPDPKPPDDEHGRRQRVGVLSPPGTISQSLVNRVHRLAHVYNGRIHHQHLDRHHHHDQNGTETTTTNNMALASIPQRQPTPLVEIAVIQTSHIPPYGYGKNHGYTKLIRYSPNPLLLQVLDALSWALQNSNNSSAAAAMVPDESTTTTNVAVTMADVIMTTRQILRWHCRVSHIAAHTAVLSIPMVDFFMDNDDKNSGDDDAVDRIANTSSSPSSGQKSYDAILQAFVQSSPLNNPETEIEPAQQRREKEEDQLREETVRTEDDDKKDTEMDDDHTQDDDRLGMVEATWSHAHRRILLHLGGSVKVVKVMDDVLLDELDRSKNFTKWPCLSFWGADTDPTLSAVSRRLAQALSPDCEGGDPYANCFVARDRCESRGDAACRNGG
jgi:hypothetical protein